MTARLVRFVATVACVLLASGAPAHAHTDLDFTLPTDGASVGDPIDEITVAFTSPVTLVGNGFEVLDPQGNVIEPFAVTDDDQVFRLQLDPPLAGGAVGVRWAVRAEDGHELTGSFSFTVDTPPPTTTTTAPAATPTTPPPTAAPAAAATTSPAATAAPATTTTSAASPATTDAPADGAADSAAGDVAEGAATEGVASSTDDDDGGGLGVVLVVVGALVVGAAGFFLVRSRSSAAT